VDRTGLTRSYDLTIDFARDLPPRPDSGEPGEAARLSEGPSVFRAIREQLGLRLDAARAPVDFLVIESAQRPHGN
jgi:uncharacterized protein (TIGR03435 family)